MFASFGCESSSPRAGGAWWQVQLLEKNGTGFVAVFRILEGSCFFGFYFKEDLGEGSG
jgi:hypothetical protein